MKSASISYWQKKDLDKKHQIVIVGAGIVGLTTAYFIKSANPHAKITILDRDHPNGGASIRNAGFACFGSPTELLDDIDRLGEPLTIETLKLRWEGLQLLQSIVHPQSMDYQQNGGYEIFNKSDKNMDLVGDNLEYLNAIVADVIKDNKVYQWQKRAGGFDIANNWVFNRHEGQLDPYKMIRSLRRIVIEKGVDVYSQVSVENIDYTNRKLQLNNGLNLEASHICLCTNAYTKELLQNAECRPVRNQVYVTESIPNLQLNGCYHLDQGYIYLRNIGNRILIGGARNILGTNEETNKFGNTEHAKKYLKEVLDRIFPEAKKYRFEHEWSGILGVGESKKAIVEEIYPQCYVGVRLGGMGVAIGSMIGKQLSRKILTNI